MSATPDDELITLLDGQLAGAELWRAERLLADDPASRQLLDELRTQRARLAALPRATLSDSFADNVLRRAEQQMLTPAGRAMARSAMLQEAAASGRPAWLRLPQGRRPWIYAGLATAAGITIMLVSRPQEMARLGGEVARMFLPPPLLHKKAQIGADWQAAPHSEATASRVDTLAAKTSESEVLASDDGVLREALDEAGLEPLSSEVFTRTEQLVERVTRQQQHAIHVVPGVVVVDCTIRPSAWRDSDVKNPLAEERAEKSPADGVIADAVPQALVPQHQRASNKPAAAASAAPATTSLGSIANGNDPHDVVCVVAPAAQIDAAIQQWQARGDVTVQVRRPEAQAKRKKEQETAQLDLAPASPEYQRAVFVFRKADPSLQIRNSE